MKYKQLSENPGQYDAENIFFNQGFILKITNMKSINKSLFLFCVLAVSFMSCETYSDPKPAYSPIYPLSGEWRVRITNVTTGVLDTTAMYTLGTYNTSENVANQMWIRITPGIAGMNPFSLVKTVPRTLLSKVSCDVVGLTFSTTDVTQNLTVAASPTWPAYKLNSVIDTITVTEAKITLNSVAMPSGVKSDRITFKLTKSKVPNVTFLVDGFRTTRWDEDNKFIKFK